MHNPDFAPGPELAAKARMFSRRLAAAERRGWVNRNRCHELRVWLDRHRAKAGADGLAMFIADFRFAMDLEARSSARVGVA